MISAFIYNIGEENIEKLLDLKQNPDIIHISVFPYLTDYLKNKSESVENFSAFRKIFPNAKLLFSLPFVPKGKTFELFKENFVGLCKIADGFTLQNLGDYITLKELFEKNNIDRKNYFLAGDYALNISNSVAADFWADKLDMIALQPELPKEKARNLAIKTSKKIITELMSGGRVIVMRSEHCYAAPVNGSFGCGKCNGGSKEQQLTAQDGKIFDIICNPLNCSCILLSQNSEKFLNLDNNDDICLRIM